MIMINDALCFVARRQLPTSLPMTAQAPALPGQALHQPAPSLRRIGLRAEVHGEVDANEPSCLQRITNVYRCLQMYTIPS